MVAITRDDAEQDITNTLRILRKGSRVAFALSCAERLFPVYEAFTMHERWGDARALRRAIDQLWRAIRYTDDKRFDQVEEELIALAPDSEEFASPFTALSQYSISACVHAYEEYLGKPGGATLASRVSFDCLLEYVEWVAAPIQPCSAIDEEYDWFTEPIVQYEIKKQMGDLEMLKTLVISDTLENRLKAEGYLGIQPRLRHLIVGPV